MVFLVKTDSFTTSKQLKELLLAAEVGNIDRMKNLIDATKQFGYTNQWMTSLDKKGRSPLIIASMHGYTNVVELIIKEIIESTDDEKLRTSYINCKDYKGRSSLFYSVGEGHFNVIKLLVETGANIETITNEKHALPGSTLLMGCAEKNHVECFDYLIMKGADIFAKREDGSDATYIAARYGHTEIINRIVDMSDAPILINRPTFRQRTALVTSAFHGHIDVCKALISHVENINHRDIDGITALMYASAEGNVLLVQWLIFKGADISIKSKGKENALEFALKNKQKDVAKVLRTCSECDQQKENPMQQRNIQRRVSMHPNISTTKRNSNQRRMSLHQNATNVEHKKNQRRMSFN